MRSLYDAPRYYGMLFDARVDDVRFYVALADHVASALGHPAHVIDCGAGAGRVTVALASRGHLVTAVENAPAMVEALRERLAALPDEVRARVTIRDEDAENLALEAGSADLALCAFNGLAHLETVSQLAAFFARTRAHLAPGGLFAFDVWLPAPALLSGAETRSPWMPDPHGGGLVQCLERFAYEPLSQVLTASIVIVDERGRTRDRLQTRLRQFFPQETLALLAHHGLRVLHRTASFERFPDAARASCAEPDEMLAYVCAVIPQV
ncbi:MAG: class I SAM-dependent methyltransferase [Deltaproteobacteria bacterium]